MADQLEDLLRDCTVQVTGGPMLGAGFFVAPGTVLTCAHVTGRDAELAVRWERDGQPVQVAGAVRRLMVLTGTGRPIPALDEGYPDIAVLGVDGFGDHPCVGLDPDWPAQHDGFMVFGYPREGGATRLTPARLAYRGTNGTMPMVYLDLASDTIKPGMSGAAVLNLRTGAVCGVVVASKHTARPDGALAIPWSAVAMQLSDVLAANNSFHRADRRWAAAHRGSRDRTTGRPDVTAIRSYLAAAQAAARQHPYTISIAGAPPLSAVYLRQQLGVQVDQAPRAEPPGPAEPAAGVTAGQILEALARLDIDEILDRNQGALITGSPGSGKSSLLRYLVESSAEREADGPLRGFVPVLAHARSLLGSLPLNKAIAAAVRHDLGAGLDDIDLDALLNGAPAPDVPWLILLDGLDEIFEFEDRQRVIEIVRRWWDDPRYRFLIASRPLPERELHLLRSGGIPVFEVQAFTADQLPMLARRWFGALGLPGADSAVEEFLAQVQRARMRDLVRNPLIATISCVVFAGHPARGLPYGRADLYESFVTLFLEKFFEPAAFLAGARERVDRYGAPAGQAIEAVAGDLRELVQQLAVARFAQAQLSLRAEAGRLTDRYRPAAVPPDVWQHVTAELLTRTGLISVRADDLAFSHETLAEYLAACAYGPAPRTWQVAERWRLMSRAGSGESHALFVAAVLHRHGADLTGQQPAPLQGRRLLRSRLVAAMAHDGCALDRETVATATEHLAVVAVEKPRGIPFILRRGIWEDEDCVLAAKALTLLDKERGLDLLFTLAADVTVPSFSVFDVLSEVMVREDLTEIDSARGLEVLFRLASVPGTGEVDRAEDSDNRMMIAGLIMDRDVGLGIRLLSTLARDQSMDLQDRRDCIKRLIGLGRLETVLAALAEITADSSQPLRVTVAMYRQFHGLDAAGAVAALRQAADDSGRSALVRAMLARALLRDAPSEGAQALRDLAADPDVPGFYRVYDFTGAEAPGMRADRLAASARDATLPAGWRIFAAEELLDLDHRAGMDALRAIQAGAPADRPTRTKAAIRARAYGRSRARAATRERPADAASSAARPAGPAPDQGAKRFGGMRLVIYPGMVVSPPKVNKYLLSRETAHLSSRFHPASLLPAAALFTIASVAAGCAIGVAGSGWIPVTLALWVLAIAACLMRVVAWSRGHFVLTDQRIVVFSGTVFSRVTMFPLGALTSLYFERSVTGRVLGYGSIGVGTRSIPDAAFRYVRNAGPVYQAILEQMPK